MQRPNPAQIATLSPRLTLARGYEMPAKASHELAASGSSVPDICLLLLTGPSLRSRKAQFSNQRTPQSPVPVLRATINVPVDQLF